MLMKTNGRVQNRLGVGGGGGGGGGVPTPEFVPYALSILKYKDSKRMKDAEAKEQEKLSHNISKLVV